MTDSVSHQITACPLDCPDACSLSVRVDNGVATEISAGPTNPVTAGFICGKVAQFAEHVHGSERVLHPLIRTGRKGSGSFRRATYDEALDLIAERLRLARDRFGGESILPIHYGGSNGLLSDGLLDERLFRRLRASRVARNLCAAPTGRAAEAMYGRMPGVPYGDYPEARLIVIWGANPSATGIHLIPFIHEARRRGARLVVIDPRRTPLAKIADLHLPVRPGTDLQLALGVIALCDRMGAIDEAFLARTSTGKDALLSRARSYTLAQTAEATGIDAASIEAFARLYAESEPAVIRCGWGQERNRNGGSATLAILALPALLGKFGVRGGGYTMSNPATWGLNREPAIAEPEAQTRIVPLSRLGKELMDATPPIRVLFSYNLNPLSTIPHQNLLRAGLERDDLFTVVFEQVWTDSVPYADVVLPATTFLEHDEFSRGYGAYVMHRSAPVIPPVGEARSNIDVFAALIERLNLSKPSDITSADALVDQILDATPDGARLKSQLSARGFAEPTHGTSFVQMRDVFPRTQDGLIHLFPEALVAESRHGLYVPAPSDEGADHPFTLISPATSKTISSTLGQRVQSTATVLIHPEDATRAHIADGDPVRVHNSLGEVDLLARVSTDVRPQTLVIAKGLWARHTLNGRTSNALCPDHLSDIGAGACYNDARVALSRLSPP